MSLTLNLPSAKAALFALLAGFVSTFATSEARLGQEAIVGNETQLAEEMVELIKKLSLQRDPDGPVKRLNQIKSQACLSGELEVNKDIPLKFRHGLFAQPGRYPVYARFANASTLDDSEKDLRGFSMQVRDVPGKVIWGEANRLDFLFNSHPVLFADSPEVFRDFIQAQYDDAILGFFLNPFDSHLNALRILLSARDRPTSLFDIRYWSTTAYRLGPSDQAVKYSVKPCSDYRSDEPDDYTADYLRSAMERHLKSAPVCFDLMLQMQRDAESMPIEDPTVEWDESESPFISVAQIIFENQDFQSAQAMQRCELVSFNPWQTLAAHKPLGRINLVRRLIYEKMATFRASSLSEKPSLR